MSDSIVVSSINKSYAGRKVLDNINFTVGKGVVHGFLGPNGAGKSTTMKIIAGILTADDGQVSVEGKDLYQNLNECKKMIGLLPENPPLYLDMVVEDYLMFVARLYKVNSPKSHIEGLMEKLGLAHQSGRLIGNLSKGYKQKVGVAQAMVGNPPILLLDEPTVGLDPHAVVEMRNLIVELGRNHTILLSSHLLHEVSLSCQDITIINEGKIVRSGSLNDIQNAFNSKKILTAQVSICTNDQKQALEKLNFIERVEVNANQSTQNLSIYIKTDSDVRKEVSQVIVENGMGLLNYSEERMQLEDIFIEITKNHSAGSPPMPAPNEVRS